MTSPAATYPPFPRPRTAGLLITDLDGTLARSDRTFSPRDLDALHDLGRRGIIRVVATGRSMLSFRRLPQDLPLDFVIFSTGAGVARHPDGHIIRRLGLSPHETAQAAGLLLEMKQDFMIHPPIPENHRFAFWRLRPANPDLDKRLTLYQGHCWPGDGDPLGFGQATQLLAILPPPFDLPLYERIRENLPGLNVIRTTSPLDHQSTWVEIFPGTVSKSRTAAWLAAEFGLTPADVLSVGNDFNDLDLLEWAGTSFVVANAPQELKCRFPAVASNDQAGLAEAIQRWLNTRVGGGL